MSPCYPEKRSLDNTVQVQWLSKMIVSLLKQPDFDSKNYKNLSEVSIFQELTTQNLKKKVAEKEIFLIF